MRAMNDLFDVSGKTALVTGGSRGIGLMIARGLVQAGARVIVSSRKAEDVQAAAQELSQLGDCIAIPGDISTQAGAAELAAAASAHFGGRLDILVNNAGAVWGAPLEEFPAAGWEKVLHTNVEGIFHLTVALLPALRAGAGREDPARVINIGSIDGLRTPGVENYSYSASKAAVHMLTRHLAKRLAGEQITINAIAPGRLDRSRHARCAPVVEATADVGNAAIQALKSTTKRRHSLATLMKGSDLHTTRCAPALACGPGTSFQSTRRCQSSREDLIGAARVKGHALRANTPRHSRSRQRGPQTHHARPERPRTFRRPSIPLPRGS
jgi:NAD(P)-dependent dehydrogenase (short-subunit alcohol dehydrogenase family)